MALPGQWQPELETVKQMVGYLKDSLEARDPNVQKNATMVCAFTVWRESIMLRLTHSLF